MSDEDQPQSPSLHRFREYLMILARAHMDRRLRGKLDASDVVQQTLLDAHEKRHQYRGATDAELALVAAANPRA